MLPGPDDPAHNALLRMALILMSAAILPLVRQRFVNDISSCDGGWSSRRSAIWRTPPPDEPWPELDDAPHTPARLKL
jgi:hypothetical protein